MSEQNDDQIIAIVFKRSLIVIVLAIIALVVWTILQGREQTQTLVEERAIAPQQMASASTLTPPQVLFTDITQAAGITHIHQNGAYGERLLPETMGGGVAVLDFNNDQLPDLLFVSGRSWPWQQDHNDSSSLALYRGDGTGNFTDVTEKFGLTTSLYGMGVAVGDYDMDGYTDIFITTVGSNRLFRNVDGQRFTEVSKLVGVAGDDQSWSTGAAFIDYDNDGDLDLMVLNYVHWSRDIDLEADFQIAGLGRAYGPPAQFAGTDSWLYQNNGDGSYTDVSQQAGIQVANEATNLPVGKALSVLPTDVDGDGWTDLVVANDTVRNFLFRNNAGQGFVEIGEQSGLAFDNNGIATGAMGIDGSSTALPEEYAIAIGNFGNEMTSLYVRSENSSLFTDQAIVTGVGPASRRAVTFGLFFFDYDLDGWADLLQVNGHVENDINVVEPGQEYAQVPQLFWNCGLDCPRQFSPIKLGPDNDLATAIVGRGAAYVDIDLDGDQDVVLTQIGGAPRLLRNDQNTGHNWIQVEVLNRNGLAAYGARVTIKAATKTQNGWVEPTRSYLSQVESILTFGIGKAESIDQVIVNWPDGSSLSIDQPSINQRHRIIPPK